jgi:hypothetical protein
VTDAGSQRSGEGARAVFRTPRGPAIVSLAALLLCGGVSIFLTLVAVFALIKRQWGLAAVVAAVACFVAGLCGYVARDLRGKWSLRVVLEPHALVLDLPAGRSLIHRPPPYRREMPYADIAAVETRLEGYRTLGMAMMQRAYVLHRKDGELIFLFEDRAIGAPLFESALFPRLAAEIARRAGVPLRDLGMAEGDGGFLGVWGTHAPDWAAPALPADLQRRMWRAVVITGALPIPVIIIALTVRILVG